MARQTQEQVAAEIAGLAGLSLEELRRRWEALYGNPAPPSLRRDLLIRAVAYQLQVKAFGGLSGRRATCTASHPNRRRMR